MRALTTGKRRGLQQCSTRNGALAVLALDHRGNLRQALSGAGQRPVGDSDLISFKREVTSVVSPAASAILLDPQYGAFQAVTRGDLSGQVGMIVAVEATGYAGDAQARQSRILDGWSVRQAKRMGASAVKLLVYYHPDAPTAPAIEALVKQVAQDCRDEDITLMLEPLAYSPVPDEKLQGDARRAAVIETARRLTPLGADILKAEFPLDVAACSGEDAWRAACLELSTASVLPWVLLSASVDYETYLRQVLVACQSGASGVAAGRAVWKEACDTTGIERLDFLRGEAISRMQRLAALCDAMARPWHTFFDQPDPGADFYAVY